MAVCWAVHASHFMPATLAQRNLVVVKRFSITSPSRTAADMGCVATAATPPHRLMFTSVSILHTLVDLNLLCQAFHGNFSHRATQHLGSAVTAAVPYVSIGVFVPATLVERQKPTCAASQHEQRHLRLL